jgi:hypothetical protein
MRKKAFHTEGFLVPTRTPAHVRAASSAPDVFRVGANFSSTVIHSVGLSPRLQLSARRNRFRGRLYSGERRRRRFQ